MNYDSDQVIRYRFDIRVGRNGAVYFCPHIIMPTKAIEPIHG